MSIIFLDIDGVMLPYTDIVDYPQHTLDNLKMIVDQTNAEIVLSSMWRFDNLDQEEVRRQLQKVNLDYNKTTSTNMRKVWRANLAEMRERSIELYIQENKPKDFVILDDLNLWSIWDKHYYKSKFVKCDPYVGLTDDKALKAIQILKGES